MDNKGDFVAGIIVGALVGFGAGILMAPASGEETRSRIKHRTGELAMQARDKSGEMMNQARASAEELALRAKESAIDVVNKLRERMADSPAVVRALDDIEDELDAEPT